MQKKNKVSYQQSIQRSLVELEAVRQNEDERAVCLAQANLGYWYIQSKKYETGQQELDNAIARAESMGDLGVKLRCLGIQVQAYQNCGRLPDAFRTAQQIQQIAEQNGDDGLLCDALASQGQILLDSGEPMGAFEKLKPARVLAEKLADHRRQMYLMGSLGNFSQAIAALDQAEDYFEKASLLARFIGNEAAEYGFLGNKAAVLAWQNKHSEAIPIFQIVLDYLHRSNDEDAEIQILGRMAQSYQALGNNEMMRQAAENGLTLARERDHNAALVFLEMLIPIDYAEGSLDIAHKRMTEAVHYAHLLGDMRKENELLMNLGESYLAQGQYVLALETYQSALDGVKQLERAVDEAYLAGRVALTLGELGRYAEAQNMHQQALLLARQYTLWDLEGEQLSMLALNCRDQGDLEQAIIHCQKAVDIFTQFGLAEQEHNARQLLNELCS